MFDLTQSNFGKKKPKKNSYQVTLSTNCKIQFKRASLKRFLLGFFQVYVSLERRPIFQMSKEKEMASLVPDVTYWILSLFNMNRGEHRVHFVSAFSPGFSGTCVAQLFQSSFKPFILFDQICFK